MTARILQHISFASALLLLISSCSNTRYIPANDALYTGATVKVEAPDLKKSKRKTISKNLAALARPKPNSSILGLRVKLWFWNIGGNPKRKFSARRLVKRFGEPPVLLSDLNLEKNTRILQSSLENEGYFTAKALGDVEIKNKRARAVYTARPGSQYLVNEVIFQQDSSALQKAINRTKNRSLLKKGAPFNLDLIKAERERIDARLKQRGFYFFNPDNLLIDVDTTIGNHLVNLYVNTKSATPEEARKIYRIQDVVIYPSYSINTAFYDTNKRYGIQYDDYMVIDSSRLYKPKLFAQAMQFRRGDLYNRGEHNTTLNRLINLGIFKFVKNRFEIAGDSLLNAYYYLTPLPKKSLRVELGGNTKSNNLTGSQVTIGFTNRNTFGGGEILTINT
ncbi:MAG: hypothetical protein ABI687_04905, partial [Flavitalea sp.]